VSHRRLTEAPAAADDCCGSLTLDRCDNIAPEGADVLVKVRVVGDGPSSVRPWQQSRVVAGRSPVFDLELLEVEIFDISIDKLQLVVWDVSNGQVAPNGPGMQNTNFLGEVSFHTSAQIQSSTVCGCLTAVLTRIPHALARRADGSHSAAGLTQ